MRKIATKRHKRKTGFGPHSGNGVAPKERNSTGKTITLQMAIRALEIKRDALNETIEDLKRMERLHG